MKNKTITLQGTKEQDEMASKFIEESLKNI